MNTPSKREIRVRLPKALLAKLEEEARRRGLDAHTLILLAVRADLARSRPPRRR